MLNWLVIGVGDITTKRVIPAIQQEPRSHLYGIVTRDPAKGRPYTENVWPDLARALYDPKIDAVYVASPVFLHAEQTIMALRSGKHVLCEKPMAMNYEEAQAMVEAAQVSGKTFGVAYYRRTYPAVQRAIQLINAGVIGTPVLVEASAHSELPIGPNFREWLVDPAKSGGGPLFDIGSHRIDLINYLFGQPIGVCAHLSNIIHNLDVEDSATLITEYSTGVRSIVDVRWHCQTPRDEFRVTGTAGELNLTPLNSGRITFPGGEEHLPPPANLHYGCIENFVKAALDGAPLLSSGATAIWTDWVTEQALATASGEQH